MEAGRTERLARRRILARALACLTLTATVLAGAQTAVAQETSQTAAAAANPAYTLMDMGYYQRVIPISLRRPAGIHNVSPTETARWIAAFTAAVEAWNSRLRVAGVRFVFPATDATNTVTIYCFDQQEDAVAASYVPLNELPSGTHRTTQFRIYLNPNAHRWAETHGISVDRYYLAVAVHELAHVLGLDDTPPAVMDATSSAPPPSVMNVDQNQTEPQEGDVLGVLVGWNFGLRPDWDLGAFDPVWKGRDAAQ